MEKQEKQPWGVRKGGGVRQLEKKRKRAEAELLQTSKVAEYLAWKTHPPDTTPIIRMCL